VISVEQIVGLYEDKGAGWYGGERVTQLEHALQCAGLALREGATHELVAAAFLHDLGHLLAENNEVHQYLPLPFLRPAFGNAVLEPIRLHVDAKRYLCFADPQYWASLSEESKRSLEFQGGAFDARQAGEFLQRPFAGDAARLRRWDDLAKLPGAATPRLGDIAKLLADVASCHKTATAGA
jgi:phosphonate degradation associated HDIG domain protein